MMEENSILKPRTLCYIALCNYKIANISIAYRIAHKAKKQIPKALQNGSISGLSGEMVGEKSIYELINTIEEKYQEMISDINIENNNIDENLMVLDKVSKYLNN